MFKKYCFSVLLFTGNFIFLAENQGLEAQVVFTDPVWNQLCIDETSSKTALEQFFDYVVAHPHFSSDVHQDTLAESVELCTSRGSVNILKYIPNFLTKRPYSLIVKHPFKGNVCVKEAAALHNALQESNLLVAVVYSQITSQSMPSQVGSYGRWIFTEAASSEFRIVDQEFLSLNEKYKGVKEGKQKKVTYW